MKDAPVNGRMIYFTRSKATAEAYQKQLNEKHGDDYSAIVSHAGNLREHLEQFRKSLISVLIVAGTGSLTYGWSVEGEDITIEFADDFPKEGPFYVQAMGRVRNRGVVNADSI